MQAADREGRAEIDLSAGADEEGGVVVGVRPGDVTGSVEPFGIGDSPASGATQSCTRCHGVTGRVSITVPIEISGLGLRHLADAHAEERRRHHQGGSGEQSGGFAG